MKKNFLCVFAMLLIMASCSSDELVNDVSLDGDGIETKSALDKIFTVKKIISNVSFSGYSQNEISTDSFGNLYYGGYNSLVKYEPLTGEISELSMPPNSSGWALLNGICVDNTQNIYYTNGEKLYKISPDGNSITDMTPRFPIDRDNYDIIHSVCAADNGNVFVGITGNKAASYRLSPQGKVTVLNDSIPNFSFKGAGLFKPKGAFVYGKQHEGYNSNSYIKMSTKTGDVETFTTHTNINGLTAAWNKALPYALLDNSIIQLRPNNAKDLLIGTIPSFIKDENGKFIEIKSAKDIMCCDPDGKVFYIRLSIKGEQGYFYEDDAIYKLTLE